jgi:hypothetical protein
VSEDSDIVKALRIKKQTVDGEKPSWEFIDRVYEIIKPIFTAQSYYLQRPFLDKQCWIGMANKENIRFRIFLHLGNPADFKTSYWYAQLVYPRVEKDISAKELEGIIGLINAIAKELEKIGMEEFEL